MYEYENNDEIKEEPDYKVFEMISTLFAIVFCVGLFIKFLFF
jgi:hypothetical protein